MNLTFHNVSVGEHHWHDVIRRVRDWIKSRNERAEGSEGMNSGKYTRKGGKVKCDQARHVTPRVGTLLLSRNDANVHCECVE